MADLHHQGDRVKRTDDPSIKVGIYMPATLYQRLREYAERGGTSISKLCREGALRELERVEPPEAT